MARWFYLPVWSPAPLPPEPTDGSSPTPNWLFFVRPGTLGDDLANDVAASARVVRVLPGDGFERLSDGSFRLDPRFPDGYRLLLAELRNAGGIPPAIVHAWSVDNDDEAPVSFPETADLETAERSVEEGLDCGLRSLVLLAQALDERGDGDDTVQRVFVLSSNMQDVTGDETPPAREGPPSRLLSGGGAGNKSRRLAHRRRRPH